MLIVMKHDATEEQMGKVLAHLKTRGFQAEKLIGSERTAIGIMGNRGFVDLDEVTRFEGVREILHVSKPYKLVSREWRPDPTIVDMGFGVKIGGDLPRVVIGGPCCVENEEMLIETARELKKVGVHALRGGAFKPRTSPYSFQGLGVPALHMLRKVGDEYQMPIVTELLHIHQLDALNQYADVIQIGARNMQNFEMLVEVGKSKKPVLLKRGMSATVEEFLLAAEYILSNGNSKVILCERGIRTFETSTRNTLDLNSVALMNDLSHLPILVDPSHGTGVARLVARLAKGSLAVGAHGLMIEVHPNPSKAFSDGAQSLDLSQIRQLMSEMKTQFQTPSSK